MGLFSDWFCLAAVRLRAGVRRTQAALRRTLCADHPSLVRQAGSHLFAGVNADSR